MFQPGCRYAHPCLMLLFVIFPSLYFVTYGISSAMSVCPCSYTPHSISLSGILPRRASWGYILYLRDSFLSHSQMSVLVMAAPFHFSSIRHGSFYLGLLPEVHTFYTSRSYVCFVFLQNLPNHRV
jgi:hypothetical protein